MSSLYKQFKKLLPKGFPTGVRAFRTLAKKDGPSGVQALISSMPDDAKAEVVARIRENLASLDDPEAATAEDVIKATEKALYSQSKTPDAVTPGDETPANNLSDSPDTSGTDLGATPYQALPDDDKAFLAANGFPEKDIKDWPEASLQGTLEDLRSKEGTQPDSKPAPAEQPTAPPAETVAEDTAPAPEVSGGESAIMDSQFGDVVGGEEYKKPAMDMSLLSQSAPPAGDRDILQFPGVRSSEAADTSPQLGLMAESSPEQLADAMDAAEAAAPEANGMPAGAVEQEDLMRAIAAELGYDVAPKQPIDFTDLLGPGGPQANAGQATPSFDASQDMSALFGGGQAPSPTPSPEMSPQDAARLIMESRNQSDFVPPFDASQDMSQLFGDQGMPGQTPEMPAGPTPAEGFDPSQGMESLFGSGPTSDKDPRFAFDPENADYTPPDVDNKKPFSPMGDTVDNIKFLKNMGAGYPAAVGDFVIRNSIPLGIAGGLGYAGLKGLGFFPGADQNAVDVPEDGRMQDLQSAHDQMQQRLMQKFVK